MGWVARSAAVSCFPRRQIFFMDAWKYHAEGLKALECEAGDDCPSMWYSGGSIPILPGGALYKNENSPGGNQIMADLQLTCLTADFGAGFDFNTLDQQTFNYPGQNGQLYRVAWTIMAPNSWQVRIMANSAAEGL